MLRNEREVHEMGRELAREWLGLGRSALRPDEAFNNFWRGFNSLYGPPYTGPEFERIRTFLSAKISAFDAEAILADHPERVEYLLSQPVVDMRGNGRDTTVATERFAAATDAQSKLTELFAVIYQVRCNLEHGQKSPTSERDLRLCACSAPLVAEVIERCV